MRKFEKISFDQFKKDIKDDKDLYDKIILPSRSTNNSAGYDIRSMEYGIINSGESKIFKTGLKVSMDKDNVLLIIVRSSLGYKYNVTLLNSVGVIDADYYNNESNEGHFSIKLINNSTEPFEVNIGDRIAQGIFIKYLTIDDENEINNKRIGGFGSTNKE